MVVDRELGLFILMHMQGGQVAQSNKTSLRPGEEVATNIMHLTDYSLLLNGLVSVQNNYSSFLRSTTEYNFIIGFKINKKQFRVGEYWNITFICTRHAKIH